jgi:hypothetical protein
LSWTQGELQQKYELLAQLEEDSREHVVDGLTFTDMLAPAAAWCDVGTAVVDVIEGLYELPGSQTVDGTAKISVRIAVQSQRITSEPMSTKWRANMKFHATMHFKDRARDEILLLQVRPHEVELLTVLADIARSA